ncbi:hypothetical protein JHK87_020795 [Glycine soja]|nr:hypothetical protein JHK87_020795 [Glycine soja]
MMFFGFIFLIGLAILSHQTVPGSHETRKIIHLTLHFIAIILGIVGLCAVFKFYDMVNWEDVTSLHSWIGIGTFCLVGLQWLMGQGFMLQGSAQSRSTMAPWHVAAGRALFFMAICAALTGLMEKYTMIKLVTHHRESHLINFTGLAILLFGVFVDMSVGLPRYA